VDSARVNVVETLQENATFDNLAKTKCAVVSRRRAFSTTCACRRRTRQESDDYGLDCINNLMRCPQGVWDGAAKSCKTQDEAASESDIPTVTSTTTTVIAEVVRRPINVAKTISNPVVEVFLYRAQEYEGQSSQYMLENVDMADLPGVLQYIHREIITEHQIASVDKETGQQRMARKYDISTILEYRFLIRNPDSQSKIQQDFHGYETYDFGQASNTAQWLELSHSDHVGAQRQSNKFVPFRDPYYWFSVSGFCPNLPYSAAAITAVCKEDPTTQVGTCASKSDAMSRPCSGGNRDLSKCLCYSDGASVVWGGLCGATADRKPPSALEVPTGQRGCVYSYDPAPKTVNLDELVGITNEDCGGRSCTDYADFRAHCTNAEYKKSFTALGRVRSAPVCVEYDLHPDCAQLGCDHRSCQQLPAERREVGLPFWKGRCSGKSNSARAEQAAALFGVADATSKHVITHPPSAEYTNVKCERGKNLECRANKLTGEGFCTRAWSGVCTSCRVPGFKRAPLNRQTPLCPWSVVKEYSSFSKDSCRTQDPSDICCMYFDSCNSAAGLTDSGFSHSLGTRNTDTIKAFLVNVATELLEVSASDVHAADSALTKMAYWFWGSAPDAELVEFDKLRLKRATDHLAVLFPGSKKYTTLTTTTTTTTRRMPRRFVPLTTKKYSVPDATDLPEQCQCSMSAVVNGIHTNRPGCAKHMGRQFGDFCYVEGKRECPGVRYSSKLKLFLEKVQSRSGSGCPLICLLRLGLIVARTH